jgi:hypothetical protein
VDLRHVAAVPPQPHEPGRVPEQEGPDRDPDDEASSAGARMRVELRARALDEDSRIGHDSQLTSAT